jgi:ATP-dependent DNA helicase RecG
LLPQKVIREAVVNALMHRDYQVNQPTLVVRYSNRLEIRNAGYSLKPTALLGEMGSLLRNPVIAGVLYDLEFAETKGTGIRTMRRLLQELGLTAPVFSSHQLENQFSAIYLLHQLLGEAQLRWLQQFSHLQLTADEAKALILAAETGAVDNAALRAISDLDTLAASQILGRLHHQRGLRSCRACRCSRQKARRAASSTQIRVTSGQIRVTSAQIRVTYPGHCAMRWRHFHPRRVRTSCGR